MSLRTRLTLATGGAVLVALVVASVVVYTSVRTKLHEQIDATLITTAQAVSTKVSLAGLARIVDAQRTSFSGGGTAEVVPSVGALQKLASAKESEAKKTPPRLLPPGKAASLLGLVPLDKQDLSVASGEQVSALRDVAVGGRKLRLYSLHILGTQDGLVRTYRPLTEANATLRHVATILIALTIGGAFAAALLGRLAAAAVLRPVRTLAGAVEEVKATHDLSRRIPVEGHDEVGRLGGAFNAMLAELDESLRSQQQLIADASHELRTPLTAHRTNVELLARDDLPPERRGRVLASAVRGIEELSRLVNDLIQAARNGKSIDQREPVRLDRLVAESVERARLRSPGLAWETALEPATVLAAPTRLERALDNVLDNAVKWSPEHGTVEVAVGRDGLVAVRDHGRGFDDGDLPHVFDRFYRAAAARGLPGSGLGLAIVKQTVEDHEGSVTAANAAGGGAVVSLRLPALSGSSNQPLRQGA
jgi:two-component system sensor histidine kinase MprB